MNKNLDVNVTNNFKNNIALGFSFSITFWTAFFSISGLGQKLAVPYEINFLFAHVCVRDLKVNDETNLYGLKASCNSGASECE